MKEKTSLYHLPRCIKPVEWTQVLSGYTNPTSINTYHLPDLGNTSRRASKFPVAGLKFSRFLKLFLVFMILRVYTHKQRLVAVAAKGLDNNFWDMPWQPWFMRNPGIPIIVSWLMEDLYGHEDLKWSINIYCKVFQLGVSPIKLSYTETSNAWVFDMLGCFKTLIGTLSSIRVGLTHPSCSSEI